MGSHKDRSGQPGVSKEQVDEFFRQAEAYDRWWKKAEADTDYILPFNGRTAEASKAFNAVKEKVDDYFSRCQISEFDARATEFLNPDKVNYEALSPIALSPASSELAAFPLATVADGKPLPLKTGINPAWAEASKNLRSEVATPLYGQSDSLSNEQWIEKMATAGEKALESKAAAGVADMSKQASAGTAGPVSSYAPGPGFRCAGLRPTAAGSVPGGIRGIRQLQRNITLRYILATQPFRDTADAYCGLHPRCKAIAGKEDTRLRRIFVWLQGATAGA